MFTYIVRVSLRAFPEILVNATTDLKTTLEHLSALIIVFLVFVEGDGNLKGKLVLSVKFFRLNLHYHHLHLDIPLQCLPGAERQVSPWW